jgi:predicted amidophosphoribosyltransferase
MKRDSGETRYCEACGKELTKGKQRFCTVCGNAKLHLNHEAESRIRGHIRIKGTKRGNCPVCAASPGRYRLTGRVTYCGFCAKPLRVHGGLGLRSRV